jgi:hypothetical protein
MTSPLSTQAARFTDRVRLPAEAAAACRAWADIDRFEVPEVVQSSDDGWAAVGELPPGTAPELWPPVPTKTRKRKVLVTRVMYGCVPVPELEDLLDACFTDDLRFVQTGVRRPRPRPKV